MTNTYLDSSISEQEQRRRLYAGDIFLFSPSAESIALCDFARGMLEEAFAPHDPREAQFHMPVEEFVARFAPVKPAFIHHPDTRKLLCAVIEQANFDLEQTYLDVPRLRGVTTNDYLTSGVGYAHHPHRDTWYAAPMSQLNWWLPIWEFSSESAMAFHPRYFDQGVKNSSPEFNYYEWNAVSRRGAAKHIKSDTRKQPKAEESLERQPESTFVVPIGGIILFSGAQMHSTVPNTSGLARFSIDFRTVHIEDVVQFRGAPNVDSEPTGTSLRDFLRARDKNAIPDDILKLYDDTRVEGGELVFQPDEQG